jgi:hypothetical protein
MGTVGNVIRKQPLRETAAAFCWRERKERAMANDGLVLESGKRRRQVRPSHRSWTPAKERKFLEGLATSCNVKLAARTAKVSTSAAYVRRTRNATFRAAWESALASGYAQLELVMLERALHGVEKVVIARDGTKTVMREYSDRVALALLRMHRDTARIADEPVEDMEFEEAKERIVARLERLREREEEASRACAITD